MAEMCTNNKIYYGTQFQGHPETFKMADLILLINYNKNDRNL